MSATTRGGQTIAAVFWENVRTILYALLLALVIRFAIAQPFRIPSGSMQPTLAVGDYIVVSKWSYGYSRFSATPFETALPEGRVFGREPTRGDIVVFRPAAQPDTDFVKRLVGLPGDRVQVKRGLLHINGQPVKLEPLGVRAFEDPEDGRIRQIVTYRETLPGGVSHIIFDRGGAERGDCVDDLGVDRCRYDDTPEFEVPAGHYFLMGDDRDNSADSRAEIGVVPFDHLVGKAEFVFVSFNFKTRMSDPLSLITGFQADRFMKRVE